MFLSKSSVIYLFVCLLATYVKMSLLAVTVNNMNSDDYTTKRRQLLKKEKYTFMGGNITLTPSEVKANKIIKDLKLAELELSYKNETEFLAARNFLDVKEQINESSVFKIMKRLPKGASLHTHMLAAVSVDFIINNITYRDNIYGGFMSNGVYKLRFFRNGDEDERTEWKSLAQLRKENPDYDNWLKEQFLIQNEERESSDTVWTAFKRIFNTGYEMFSYRPVFEDTIYQLLLELYEDNVFYTEVKGTFMPLYELDGTMYSNAQFLEIFNRSVEKFKADHSDFLGAKYVHSVYRGANDFILKEGLNEIIQMRNLFPGLIAAFDLVGREEEGHTLFHYHDILLKAQEHIDFHFHAGETNWFGHTDINLADAILLNSKRIGHGFAITKHPELLNLAKEKDIAIELCPISNQVLMVHQDPRNHPAVHLFSIGYPVVIGNDDPSIWGATGLSYDWYVAFMAMTPRQVGIEFFKALALNSIKYSAMDDLEKKRAFTIWEQKWNEFIESVLACSES